MCSQWFFTRTGFNSCLIGFLILSNGQDLILVIESRAGGAPYNSVYQKGYLFQASGTWKGRDFTRWSIWINHNTDRLFTVPIFFVRSSRSSAHDYLHWQLFCNRPVALVLDDLRENRRLWTVYNTITLIESSGSEREVHLPDFRLVST